MVQYAYDPTGLRLKKEKSGQMTYYAFDLSGNELYKEAGTNSPRRLVWAFGAIIAQIVDNVAGPLTTYAHTDLLGSSMAISDSDGNVVWRIDYSPFGEQIDEGFGTGEGRYTGKEYDLDVELYYFNFRWYDPSIGRFVEVDNYKGDLELPPTTNPYVYCLNSPLTFVDPSGHAPTIPPPTSTPVVFPQFGAQVLVSDQSNLLNFADPDAIIYGTSGIFAGRAVGNQLYFIPLVVPEGNVERLQALALEAFRNPIFQPYYNGWTHCSEASRWVAEKMGIPDLMGMRSWEQEEFVSNPANGWVEVSPRVAQLLANEGVYVLVVGTKHCAVVVPGPGLTYSDTLFHPSILNMGESAFLYGYTLKGTVNYGWGKDAIRQGLVRYYYKPESITPNVAWTPKITSSPQVGFPAGTLIPNSGGGLSHSYR